MYIKGATHSVVDPAHIYQEMKFYITDLNTKKFSSPNEKSAFAHAQLVKIHPFYDGNGEQAD